MDCFAHEKCCKSSGSRLAKNCTSDNNRLSIVRAYVRTFVRGSVRPSVRHRQCVRVCVAGGGPWARVWAGASGRAWSGAGARGCVSGRVCGCADRRAGARACGCCGRVQMTLPRQCPRSFQGETSRRPGRWGLWVFGSADMPTALLGACLWRQVCDKDLSVVKLGLHLNQRL